jgi:PAS domain S-box-containing protein
MKILIVDDKEENLYLLETMLKASGYNVVSAMNGVKALEILQKESVRMIISDILMPKMDGFQLCRACKSDEKLKNIPFIFYTATYTTKKDEEFALSLGADRFIIKPEDPGKFLKIIQKLIKSKKELLDDDQIPEMDEPSYLKLYNERLVNKLEKRIIESEEAREALEKEISSRKETEACLLESEERLKMALKAADQGLWDWNVATGDVYFSPRWKAMLGYKGDEIPSHISSWQKLLHPEDATRVNDVLNNHLDGKTKNYKVEFRLKTNTGDWLWILSLGRVLARDENGEPLRMLGTHIDISENKKIQDKLVASVEEKNVMLQEIHHRVKNNMQIISSLLSLQSDFVDDDVRGVLEGSQNRVKSMALVHEKLYRSQSLSRINMADYIQSLVSDLFYSYITKEDQIKIIFEIEDIEFNIETAIPCGLILNELISNSLKYAFPSGRNGEMHISLKLKEDNYELIVKDDGIGLPEDLEFENMDSLGLKLVNSLITQLEGELEVDRGRGTEFKITFRELEYTRRI